MLKLKLLMFSLMVIGNSLLYSQELHSSLQLRNSHLWRGSEVAVGLVYTGDLHLDFKNFYGGFWAGGTADGSYKEFNNYAGYKNKRLTLELWDIYNFSSDATYNNEEYFNYKPRNRTFLGLQVLLHQCIFLYIELEYSYFGRDRNSSNTQNNILVSYPVRSSLQERKFRSKRKGGV